MRLLLLIALSLFLSSICDAETLWQGTRSGMTMKEVRTVFPQLVKAKPATLKQHGESFTEWRLDNVQIVGNLFYAVFSFHEDKLQNVTLTLDGTPSSQSALKVFDALTDALRKKYGKEANYSVNSGLVNQTHAEWQSQGTEISLNLTSVTNDNADLKLRYQTKS